MLCAKSIEHLSRTKTATGIKPTILYFFFDFNDSAKETTEGMIRALLCQLLTSPDPLTNDVQLFYNEHRETTSAKPSLQSWIDLFSRHLRSAQDVFIFIDALDECNEADLPFLKASLAQLLAATGKSVRWLLTSRPNVHTANALAGSDFVNVLMEQITVDKDIETYLIASLSTDPRLSSFSTAATQSIIKEITAHSSGMFRYAHCQLETIAKLRDRRMKKVQDVLRTMPKTIAESYQRILADAEQLDDWAIVERIILFVSFSTRPVTVTEVAEFAILEDDMTNIDPEDRFDLTDALATISPMITIRDGAITLAHKSVHDFFAEVSEPSSLFLLCQSADTAIAKKCLQYLRIPQEPIAGIANMKHVKEPNTTHLNKLLKDYPLLDYAATHWSHHLHEKALQEELLGDLVATLPLTAKPNLWKAWLLLQRAEIWENQIQLASILSEAFVRGTSVAGFLLDFWQHRQDYRIRNDARAKAVGKRLIKVDHKFPRKKESQHCETASNFWVKALYDFTTSDGGTYYTMLPYVKGDLIYIKTMNPSGGLWLGSCNGYTGWVSPARIERCKSNANSRISGTLHHELAVLLLEIAFQAPLSKDAMTVWKATSSINELAQYLTQLRGLTSQAVKKMGLRYGKIIDECLSHVQWVDDGSLIPRLDVDDAQATCIEKVCRPLAAIRSSGFRAARNPVKRSARFRTTTFGANTVSFEDYTSSAASAPYRAASTTEYTSYSTARVGSAPLGLSGRATSAEPAWATTTTTYLSQSATYSSSPSPAGFTYRPHSTSATALSYSRSYGVARPELASAAASLRAFSSASPDPVAFPIPATTTVLTTRSTMSRYASPLAIMDTVQEDSDMNAAVQSAPVALGNAPALDPVPKSTTVQSTVAVQNTTDQPSSRTGNDDEDGGLPATASGLIVEASAEATLEQQFVAAFWKKSGSIANASTMANASSATHELQRAAETLPDNQTSESFTTSNKDAQVHDVVVARIHWDLTEGLSYDHFRNHPDRPTDATLSDDAWAVLLDNARDDVLISDDPESQLLWARDALEHVCVAETNRSRVFRQTHRLVNVSHPEDGICTDALSVVTYLAEQNHPEASYLEAKYKEMRQIDNFFTTEGMIERYKSIADQGHARACYRAGLALERAGKHEESAVYYARGFAGGSAAARYHAGVSTICGTNGKAADLKSGMELLLNAAAWADSDAPEVLYKLGLTYAHEWFYLEANKNPAPKDYKRAVAYLKRASFFGSSQAQVRLGHAYECEELGLEFSFSLALHYYLLAARRGEAEAEMSISKIMLYLFTTGGESNQQWAHAAYTYAARAALDELPTALFAVGYFHERGFYVVADRREALKWYAKADERGNAEAQGRIAALTAHQQKLSVDGDAGSDPAAHAEDLQKDTQAFAKPQPESGLPVYPVYEAKVPPPMPTSAGFSQPPLDFASPISPDYAIQANGHVDATPALELSEKEIEEFMASTGQEEAADGAVGSTDTEKEATGKATKVQKTASGQPVCFLEEGVIKQLRTLAWKPPPLPEPDPEIPLRPAFSERFKSRWLRPRDSVDAAPTGWRARLGKKADK